MWISDERLRHLRGLTAGGSAGAPTDHGALPPRIGRFEVLDLLGRGGMGIVYRAYDPQLRREVAVKVLGAADRGDPEMISRFWREAHTAGSLNHPGIVGVYEVGLFEDAPYVVMERIDGVPLSEWIDRKDPWPDRERVILLRDVARAVEHAHAHGIIHRDLKPSNVMVEADGRPRVLDFGLARSVAGATQLTAGSQAIGTPGYMAPEQYDSGRGALGPPTDVFALGAVLFEILTRRRAIPGAGAPEILQRTLLGDFRSPRAERPDVPRDLDTICMRCLEPDPERRYRDAGVLADELDLWLAGGSIRARPIPLLVRLWRVAARHPGRSAPALAAVLLAFAVGAFAWHAQAQRARGLRDALRAATRARTADDPREALAQYRRALDFDPTDAEARAGLSWAEEEVSRVSAEKEAEDKRLRAQAAADRAALEKARCVTGVLLRWGGLGETLAALEASNHDDRQSAADKRKAGDALWPSVARFLTETPADPASQSSARALAGWARRLAGYEEEGESEIDRACATDPDLPFGPTMQALLLLGRYLHAQPLPQWIEHRTGLRIAAAPGESAETRELRAQLGPVLSRAERSPVWGEGIVKDFHAVLEAMRAYQAGDFAGAERGLGGALGIEMQVFRSEILLARANVRFLLQHFDDAVRDLEEIRRARPASVEVRLMLAMVAWGAGQAAAIRGEDPRPAIRAAIDHMDGVLELQPDHRRGRENRGTFWEELGEAQVKRGEDPSESYARAQADLEEAVKRDPDSMEACAACAGVRLDRGLFAALSGRDPRADYRAAVAELDRGIARNPGAEVLLDNRGLVHRSLGEAEAARGADAQPWFDRAIADATAALKIQPRSCSALSNRVAALRLRGGLRTARGEDPQADYRAAIEDLSALLRVDPDFAGARCDRGTMRVMVGLWEMEHGADPRPELERALADFHEALRIDPRLENAWRGLAYADASVARYDQAHGRDARERIERAIAEDTEGLRLWPDSVDLRADRADAYVLRSRSSEVAGDRPHDDLERAIADLTTVVARHPDAWRQQAGLGRVLALAGRYAESAEQLEAAAAHAGPEAAGLRAMAAQARAAADRDREPGWTRLVDQAEEAVTKGDLAGARTLFEQALAAAGPASGSESPDLLRLRAATHYNLACLLARQSATAGADAAPLRDLAFQHLAEAAALGFRDSGHAAADPDLAALRDDPRWSGLLRKMAE